MDYDFLFKCLQRRIYERSFVLLACIVWLALDIVQTGEPDWRLSCALCIIFAWTLVSAAQDYHDFQ